MTFEQQIIATIIGSFTGFLFAVVLFILSKWVEKILQERQLARNLILECKYNIETLQPLIDDLDREFSMLIGSEEVSEAITKVEKSQFNWVMDFVCSRENQFVITFFEKALDSGLIFQTINVKNVNDYISISYLLSNWSSEMSDLKSRLSKYDTPDIGKGLLNVFEGNLPKLKKYNEIAIRLIDSLQKKYKISKETLK